VLGATNEPNFNELIQLYPLTVAIPPKVHLELRERGPIPTCDDDLRVSTRFRCKGPAILEWNESPIGLPLPFPTTQVIVRNLSRTGFSVLADRQWFPEQIATIYLQKAIVTAKVMRARRLGSRCYDIGFRIVAFRHLEQTTSD
jgi:hypothetical protein